LVEQGNILGWGIVPSNFIRNTKTTFSLHHDNIYLNDFTFLSQIEDAVTREFDDICKTENLVIKWKSFPGLLRPDAYVESWRILLWEKAFPAFISTRAEKPFDKKSDFSTYPGAADVVKRVTYRYDFYALRIFIFFPFCFYLLSIL
jgi:hypothetical protein